MRVRDCVDCGVVVRAGIARGLCRLCYARTYSNIREGHTSWQDREEKGKAVPLQEKKRRRVSGQEEEDQTEEWCLADRETDLEREALSRIRREIATEVLAEAFGGEMPVEQRTAAELIRLLAERMEGK